MTDTCACGSLFTSWPALGNDPDRPRCEQIAAHRCGYPTGRGPCVRYWGHSAYSLQHTHDLSVDTRRKVSS